MLVERYNGFVTRLDALQNGRVPSRGTFARVVRRLRGRREGDEPLHLRALDEELGRAGIHTSADARLLRDLSVTKGRVAALREGLLENAQAALGEFELLLSEAEAAAGEGSLAATLQRSLHEDFRRLTRVVKVAAIFQGATPPAEIYARPALAPSATPDSARLAAAEYFATRAQHEVVDTAQKRRDLDLAYELVLRMAAETKGDRDRTRELRLHLGAARERVRGAPAVRSFDELLRHVRHAARADPPTAWRSLRALYERAAEAGDGALAQAAGEAAQAMAGPANLAEAVERHESLRASGWRESPYEHHELQPSGGKQGADQLISKLAQFAFELDDEQQHALELAAGCARYFDIEDVLADDVAEAETESSRPVRRRVPYPTQLMHYETTNSLAQLPHFVLDRPGALLLDLASGRQLVRTYLEEEKQQQPRQARRGAVRVYVLDASGSMHGARARFRDALLIAELNAIRVKATQGLPFDPLYFSFFNDQPTDLCRVDTGDEAARQIMKLFANSPAEGQTDISFALVSAFDAIGRARGTDPWLARATVVLVTDGEDGVDMELIRRTRRPYEGLEISLSFISLGEENADLKSLVLERRDAGARAFYSHLSDAEIRLARTDFDTAWRTLLPANVTVTSDALDRLLPHLEVLEQLAQGRATRDAQAPQHDFDALFPEAPTRGVATPLELTRMTDIAGAVLEAASFAPADLRRRDAVELLLHLLNVYELPLKRWLAQVRAPDEALHRTISSLRLLC